MENFKNFEKVQKPEDGFLNTDSLYPSALFPRLHVIESTKLELSKVLLQKGISKNIETDFKTDFEMVKAGLIELLNSITGDEKTSNLLLINLISKIYFKKDLDSLGNFTLNLINSDQNIKVIMKDGKEVNHSFVDILYSVIQKLLPASMRLDLSIKNLSNLSLKPQKDHNLNCLNRGALQVANETFLLIDENQLEVGTLGDKAVRNLQALQNLIQSQTLIYDFVYYEVYKSYSIYSYLS